MRSVYGPVRSWRFGRSLGIDPIGIEPKICSFNCLYCQLGTKGILTSKRSEFVSSEVVKEELELALAKFPGIDIITFSGTGEPTLASNFGELVDKVRSLTTVRIGVLTNSSLLSNSDVRHDVMKADVIVAKLDAATESTFFAVNHPHEDIEFADVIHGIEMTRKEFDGSFQLEVMFVEENMQEASGIAEICKRISPDILYLNTPLRPCAKQPLGKREMKKLRKYFEEFTAKMVYDEDRRL
ncbi:MAG: radical SAM protein [Methanomassiliicoccales archaeon]|jgi:wyosine [tRNA(Phe)-imidazoG37] synthetase (radical SAM superfamily)|nr:radical SAM protein [Methanomassiliicoccales archaeon]